MWGRAKSSTFTKLGKHWLGFPHQKFKCAASLKALELKREKKVNMGKDLSPKHCPNRKTLTSKIHVYRFARGLKAAPKYCSNRKTSTSEIKVCRFNGGLKVAPLKS